MLNQTKRLYKSKSKSKIFITILCIFGLLFSYSCSCKNKVTGPGNDGLENGKPPITDNKDGSVITPSMTLSTNLMVIDNAGTKTTESITITVDNADFEIADITGVEGLTKADFTLANGVLSLTKSFDKVDITEKTLTLTVNYKKKSTAGANDTLSKTTDKTTFNVVKVQQIDTQSEILKNIVTSLSSGASVAGRRVQFDFTDTSAATSDTINLKNINNSGQSGDDNVASEFIRDIISEIKQKVDYQKYFKDVTETHAIDGTDATILTIELTFTPNSIYEFANTKYTIKLDNKKADGSSGGNWIE